MSDPDPRDVRVENGHLLNKVNAVHRQVLESSKNSTSKFRLVLTFYTSHIHRWPPFMFVKTTSSIASSLFLYTYIHMYIWEVCGEAKPALITKDRWLLFAASYTNRNVFTAPRYPYPLFSYLISRPLWGFEPCPPAPCISTTSSIPAGMEEHENGKRRRRLSTLYSPTLKPKEPLKQLINNTFPKQRSVIKILIATRG